jgi:flavin-binding protein dodecin
MLGFLAKEKDGGKESAAMAPQRHEDLLDDGIERPTTVKVIEVVATSTSGFDDAVKNGLRAAGRSLRHIAGADVKHMNVAVRNGRISEYRVDLKIAFALDEEDED